MNAELFPIERWAKMTIFEQLGNIGGEVERAISWRNKKDFDYSRKFFFLAIEMIDRTLPLYHKFSTLKEFCRLREALVDYFYGQNEYGSTDESWRKYFLAFALAARKINFTEKD